MKSNCVTLFNLTLGSNMVKAENGTTKSDVIHFLQGGSLGNQLWVVIFDEVTKVIGGSCKAESSRNPFLGFSQSHPGPG